jgi:hypothetical protein
MMRVGSTDPSSPIRIDMEENIAQPTLISINVLTPATFCFNSLSMPIITPQIVATKTLGIK